MIMRVENKIEKQMRHLLNNTIILNRRFLDDEQLDRKEQFKVLKEIFDVNVRDREIRELSSHFAPILRDDHPVHLSLLGKTGTGKTVTMLYFLNLLQAMGWDSRIPFAITKNAGSFDLENCLSRFCTYCLRIFRVVT